MAMANKKIFAPKLKVKKGDQVIVLTGRDKGVKGEILKVMPSESRIIVQGVNLRTKHKKPTQMNPQGGKEKIEGPIHVSNVAVVDPKEDKATRIGFKTLKDGKKVRVAKKSGETLS